MATIVPGDSEAQELFRQVEEQVKSKAGDVKIKGTEKGDFCQSQALHRSRDYADEYAIQHPSPPHYNASGEDCWWTYHECTRSKRDIPADIIDILEPRSYGISFDDGPNCSHNAFYEFLRENNQTATMLYTASNVMNWPIQGARCGYRWSHYLFAWLVASPHDLHDK
ncbi:hypothetical protein QFC20_005813 [Naganishia adeliensis]|uniref:Uncharacterized protein n=1 Tax=Naganishia adeliensis TaxID=92952 RepID=A0ACC2VHW7_9TREE|nr:hypothetical protein QFC20_005813 [Naganishia adeliensis]